MRLLLAKSYNTVLTIIIVPLTLFPLCLLLLVRLEVSTVNLCSFYVYSFIQSSAVIGRVELRKWNTRKSSLSDIPPSDKDVNNLGDV